MPYVDVSFQVKSQNGCPIKADHGYPLFGAVTNVVPEFHTNPISIHPIYGKISRCERLLHLVDTSYLILRVPVEKISLALNLSGKTLSIHGVKIDVAWSPTLRPLTAPPRLYSRLVVIKDNETEETWLRQVYRQLADLGIENAKPYPILNEHLAHNIEHGKFNRSSWLKRTVAVHEITVGGFALRVINLTSRESTILQEQGLGGRGSFGCGVFTPEHR